MKLDLTTTEAINEDLAAPYTMTVTIPPLVVTMTRGEFEPENTAAPGLIGLAEYMAATLPDNGWAALVEFIGDWSLQDDDSFDDWSDDIVFDLVRGPG